MKIMSSYGLDNILFFPMAGFLLINETRNYISLSFYGISFGHISTPAIIANNVWMVFLR